MICWYAEEQIQPLSCIIKKKCLPLQKNISMKFDLITDNENLWAVRYENCLDNVLDTILDQWNDVV